MARPRFVMGSPRAAVPDGSDGVGAALLQPSRKCDPSRKFQTYGYLKVSILSPDSPKPGFRVLLRVPGHPSGSSGFLRDRPPGSHCPPNADAAAGA